MKKLEVKPGDIYGRMAIVKEIAPHIYPPDKKSRKMLCQCVCGNEVKVQLRSLNRGKTKSCGCFQKKQVSNLFAKHRLSRHPIYKAWVSIKDRCYNTNKPTFKYWGGRGITVCQQWLDDFKSFYDWAMANGYQEGLQIDRIDNDQGYSPDNCRFVTPRENSLNRRIPSNNTSGYRWVSYRKSNNKWCAQVRVKDKNIHIGYYSTAEDAAIAYNEYVIENNLPNKLNIIRSLV